jgi:uncharacterized Zn-binding protein involved in type VI secretion
MWIARAAEDFAERDAASAPPRPSGRPRRWKGGGTPDPNKVAVHDDATGGCAGPKHGPGKVNALASVEKADGKKIARISDPILFCMGDPQPHLIAEGEFSVRVGGLPVARVTSKTTHPGAQILGPGASYTKLGPPSKSGFPKATLELGPNGKPLFTTYYSEHLKITESADRDDWNGKPPFSYTEKVIGCLDKMKETEAGRKRLADLEASGKNTTITNIGTGPDTTPDARTPGYQHGDGVAPPDGNGKPCDAVVHFDPDNIPAPTDGRANEQWCKDAIDKPDVTLFHELTHADDVVKGKFAGDSQQGENIGPKKGCKCKMCELRAIGAPPFDKPEYQPNENDYRKQRNPPAAERTYY